MIEPYFVAAISGVLVFVLGLISAFIRKILHESQLNTLAVTSLANSVTSHVDQTAAIYDIEKVYREQRQTAIDRQFERGDDRMAAMEGDLRHLKDDVGALREKTAVIEASVGKPT